MNHLRGSLVTKTIKDEAVSDDVRYVDVPNSGRVKELRSSQLCCVCSEHLWVQEYSPGCPNHLVEAFNVMDARAYKNGLPDYVNNSHVLIQCHYGDCNTELKATLNNGTFVPR